MKDPKKNQMKPLSMYILCIRTNIYHKEQDASVKQFPQNLIVFAFPERKKN